MIVSERIKKAPSREYIRRANAFPKAEMEKRLARARSVLAGKFDTAALIEIEEVALGLEIEEEQLHDWRSCIKRMREKYLG
jgi:hypothetical protein